MRIKEYLRPGSLEEAFELLDEKGAVIVGGGTFLNLGNREVERAIDISRLKLDHIRELGDFIEIGSMCTLREVETSPIIKNLYGGFISKAISEISGVQLKNAATIGGSICGKFGFSDVITPLLAADARVELYRGGVVRLEEFLKDRGKKDILVKVIIWKGRGKGEFLSLRNSAGDFSVLNTSTALVDGKIRISVGARPGRAKIAASAMDYVNTVALNEENAVRAGELAANELQFGGDLRGSEEYRRELCKVLVKRCIMGVLE